MRTKDRRRRKGSRALVNERERVTRWRQRERGGKERERRKESEGSREKQSEREREGGVKEGVRDEGMARARGSARSGNWLSVLPSPTNHPTTPRDWYRL